MEFERPSMSGPGEVTAEILKTVPRTVTSYSIGFVEYDDQGWFRVPGRNQMLRVQHMINRAAHFDPISKDPSQGIILVAFVHGWKNNASEKNQNVRSFEDALGYLCDTEHELHPQSPRPVVGVYIGWLGLATNLEPFNELSFYSRKETGDRIGLYNGVTEILSTFEKMHRDINDHRDPRTSRSAFVIFGHSFGAQVVYGAVSAIMTERLVQSRALTYPKLKELKWTDDDGNVHTEIRQQSKTNTPVQPFSDLVILVNPAFEAGRYHNIWELSGEFDYPPNQRPVLSIFQSNTDWATHFAFPVGRFFSTFFDSYRNDERRDEEVTANKTTIPWTDRLVTHDLLLRSG